MPYRIPVDGLTYDQLVTVWGRPLVEALYVRVDTYKLN